MVRTGRIPAFCARLSGAESLCLGVQALDIALGGGLERRKLHEIVPHDVFHLGAAAGFASGLAATAGGDTLVWIQQRLAALEGGMPHGPGGAPFGIAAPRWLIVKTATARDTLWAMEECLRCPGVGAVIGELSGAGDAADLTATRRLNLVLQERGALGLLLRQQALRGTSACGTRWRVAAATGTGDGLGGVGRTAFTLALEKNQRGPCGAWHVEWKDDDRRFTALPVAVAAPARHRPHRAA